MYKHGTQYQKADFKTVERWKEIRHRYTENGNLLYWNMQIQSQGFPGFQGHLEQNCILQYKMVLLVPSHSAIVCFSLQVFQDHQHKMLFFQSKKQNQENKMSDIAGLLSRHKQPMKKVIQKSCIFCPPINLGLTLSNSHLRFYLAI